LYEFLFLQLKNRFLSKQVTSSILMIRPVSFNANPETAVNNYYQKVIEGLTPKQAQTQALAEFDSLVDKLQAHGIEVIVVEDRYDPETPDAIFPNNWISFHHDGTIALYPMFAESRRGERRDDIKDNLAQHGFTVEKVKDFTHFEQQGKYLEGTGSMLLDRDRHIVYAALSDRTDKEVLDVFCEAFSYEPIVFSARQTVNGERLPIYHTNVMMCLTDKLAIISLATIDEMVERTTVIESLTASGKEIIDISEDQVSHFAGNMLAIENKEGQAFIVMSDAARQSLTEDQKQKITTHYIIIASSLDTIEALGGGSARCMMAEIFLPKK
jgi:hypothetical protein